MSTRKPWPHICVEEDCGREFLSSSNRAQRCPECRKRHKIEYDKARQALPERKAKARESARAYYSRNKEKCNEKSRAYKEANKERLKAAYREYYQRNLKKERARKREDARRYYAKHKEALVKKSTVRNKVKRGDQLSKLELAKLTGKALYCERMRVTALSLPCGKREECWNGKPCPRTVELGLTPPKRRELYDFGSWR